jgi:hypothetical protein
MDNRIWTFRECFQDVQNQGCDIHLMLGNGFSIGASRKFAYSSLFEKAKIDDQIRKIFAARNTTNFEHILGHFENAIQLMSVYPLDDTRLRQDRDKIRAILVSTLSAVHPDYRSELGNKPLQQCSDFIRQFKNIFTFNYDLILYWVCMINAGLFSDGFVKTSNDCVYKGHSKIGTCIDYMHGAIHLYENKGKTYKRVSRLNGRVIDVIRQAVDQYRYPLFISEGDSKLKKQRIAASTYLTDCWERFRKINGALFVYGHSLSSQDSHAIETIINNPHLSHLFIGIYGSGDASLSLRQTGWKIHEARSTLNVQFFNSRSAGIWEPERRKKPRA